MIDREKVITHVTAEISIAKTCKKDFATVDIDMLSDALELLKEQEAVKSRKGQWVPIESTTGIEAFGIKEMTVMNVRCSVCGSEEDVSFTGYKYCPRCGAKMEGR